MATSTTTPLALPKMGHFPPPDAQTPAIFVPDGSVGGKPMRLAAAIMALHPTTTAVFDKANFEELKAYIVDGKRDSSEPGVQRHLSRWIVDREEAAKAGGGELERIFTDKEVEELKAFFAVAGSSPDPDWEGEV
jgi:hypothetical protein